LSGGLVIEQRKRGRPNRLSKNEQDLVKILFVEHQLPCRKIADRLGVSHMCIWRTLQRKL